MDEAMIKRVMPHSLEAEKSVIGSMLMDKEAVTVATEMLSAEDFYSAQYGALFTAMADLHREGKPADLVLVQEKVRQNGAPPDTAGMDTLRGILTAVPTSTNVRHYATEVRNKSALRKLIKTAQRIEDNCYDGKEDVENILSDAEKNITEVTRLGDTNELQNIADITMDALDRIMLAAKAGGKITGIATGFKDLDYMMAGLQNSDLILVAARPAMGKTAFVLNIARYVSVHNHNATTAIFSLEMPRVQLVNRLLSMESKVDSKNIRTGNLSDSEWVSLSEGASQVGNSLLWIDDNTGVTVKELSARCRQLKRDHNLSLIIIDYIQLMSGRGRSESRQQEVAEISRSLKVLARELNVPIIALSQLSRAVESREDKRPQLSDLRESGAIEQDADVVMFLYRDDYYNHDTKEKGVAEVIIAKQRNGPTGTVKLAWLPDFTQFANLDISRHTEQMD